MIATSSVKCEPYCLYVNNNLYCNFYPAGQCPLLTLILLCIPVVIYLIAQLLGLHHQLILRLRRALALPWWARAPPPARTRALLPQPLTHDCQAGRGAPPSR